MSVQAKSKEKRGPLHSEIFYDFSLQKSKGFAWPGSIA